MRTKFVRSAYILTAAFGLLMPALAFAGVIYVDDSAGGANSGASWTDAYTDLQDALSAAASGDEIWVAAGSGAGYQPSVSSALTSFDLKNGVALYGGFAGGETQRGDRDWTANETILTGNNYNYHVIAGDGTDGTAVLDGFTIRDGAASITSSSSEYSKGGGIYNNAGSPAVRNCLITQNSAYWRGGGGFNKSGSNPNFENCVFSSNSSGIGGGVYNDSSSPVFNACNFSANTASINHGGAIYNSSDSSPSLAECEFTGNNSAQHGGAIYNGSNANAGIDGCVFTGNYTASGYSGGAIYNSGADPQITLCFFDSNTAGVDGGGVYNTLAVPRIESCLFTGNQAGTAAGNSGGAVYNDSGSASAQIINCVFTGNSANEGGAVSAYGSVVLTNSILWNDTITGSDHKEIYNNEFPGTQIAGVSYCLVETGYSGTSILSGDPLFTNLADPIGPDAAWGTGDDGLQLQSGSPAVDYGDGTAVTETMDLLGNPRVAGAQVDLGGYEYQGADPDSDNDGLPDDWEIAEFGNLDEDAAGDPDGDGFDNLLEYGLGLDPETPDSDLHWSYEVVTEGSDKHMSLRFWRRKSSADPDIAYTVEVSDTLQPGSWNWGGGYTTEASSPASINGDFEEAHIRAVDPLAPGTLQALRLRVERN